jgi:hypothetical protein
LNILQKLKELSIIGKEQGKRRKEFNYEYLFELGESLILNYCDSDDREYDE